MNIPTPADKQKVNLTAERFVEYCAFSLSKDVKDLEKYVIIVRGYLPPKGRAVAEGLFSVAGWISTVKCDNEFTVLTIKRP